MRWSGILHVPVSGYYTFVASTAGTHAVVVSGVQHISPWDDTAAVSLLNATTDGITSGTGSTAPLSLTTTQPGEFVFGSAVDNTIDTTAGVGTWTGSLPLTQLGSDHQSDGLDFFWGTATAAAPGTYTLGLTDSVTGAWSQFRVAVAVPLGILTRGVQSVTETVNGANLGFVSAPGAVTPPSTTLNGVDEVTPQFAMPLDVGDATGSGNGWNVSLNASPFTDAHGHTLAGLYQSTEPVPACDAATTCTKASDITHLVNTVNPLTYGAGNLVQVADAATGMGNQNVSPTFTLAVPANTYAGIYTSNWTVSLNSAPH